MTLGQCAWWKCRNKLGVTVYKFSKFSRLAFCCENCAQKWHQVQERQHTFEPKKLQNRVHA